MNKGQSLANIAAELERQVAQRKDYVAPQGKVEAIVVEKDDKKEIRLDGFNGDALAIRPFGHQQLGQVLDIPAKYYQKMQTEQPELLAHNINTWFRSDPANKRMIRTLDGEVRAVLSPRYRPLDNFELASAVLPKLQAMNVQVVSSELTETRMYIKAILPELSDALPPGQVWGNGHNIIGDYRGNEPGRVVAAIVISNSEVGNGSLRVEPSVFTTWCTNLAIMKQAAMKKYHVGRANEVTDNWEVFTDATREKDNAAFFAKVQDVTAAAFNVDIFRAAIDRIRRSAEEKIESEVLPDVVEVAVKELKLPVGSSTSILTFLAQGGDFSRWGLSSAITAASAKLDDYEASTVYERAGGELLELPASQWAAISKGALKKAA